MEVDTTKLATFLVGILGLIILPLGFIWSVNAVFQLNIEYTLWNWLGVAFLQLYLQLIIKASTLQTKTEK
jgi:hypothetical protein